MKWIIYILAFVEGVLVMGFELTSARLLAPYFGGSLYVITSVLGVTMISLFLGYLLGARLSRLQGITYVLLFQAIAALLFIILPVAGILIKQLSMHMGLIWGVLLSSSVILGPALILLGAITPQLVELLNKMNNAAGKSSGYIYSISTLGGVISTFLIGLFLIPNYGVKSTCFLIGTLAILPVFMVLLKKRKSIKSLSLILFVIAFACTSMTIDPTSTPAGLTQLYQRDGLLGKVEVFETENNHKMLINNGIMQSFVSNEGNTSVMTYTHVIGTLASLVLPRNRKNAAIIGLAAGCLINEVSSLGFDNIYGVDIDPRMQFISGKYFGLDSSIYTFIEDDGRHFMLETATSFDLIIIDVSASEDQPYYLFTKEAFDIYKSKLTDEGILIVNVIDKTNKSDSKIVSKIGDGMFEAGLNTLLLKSIYPSTISPDRMEYYAQEKLIIASKGNFSKMSQSLDEMNACCRHTYFNNLVKHDLFNMAYQKTQKMFEPFRDDKPEMELMNFERTNILRSKFSNK